MTLDNTTDPVAPTHTQRRIVREDIEWSNLWLPDSNKDDLPRCLLIGDSITGAYGPVVTKRMEGKAYIGIFATSKSIGDSGLIPELQLALSQLKFDVVHFNNGMHGWDYSEEEYERDFPEVLDAIHEIAPDARIIWASITPVRIENDVERFAERTERVRARNMIAAKYAGPANIPINDLFNIGEENSSYYSSDGVHFNENGTVALAEKVARHLLQAIA